MGTQTPISCSVAGVTIYNGKSTLFHIWFFNLTLVDLTNTSSMTHLVLKEYDAKNPKSDSMGDLSNKAFQVLVPKLLKLDMEK